MQPYGGEAAPKRLYGVPRQPEEVIVQAKDFLQQYYGAMKLWVLEKSSSIQWYIGGNEKNWDLNHSSKMKYQYLSPSFNEHCWKRNKMKITRYIIKEMILGGKNIFSLCRCVASVNQNSYEVLK